MKKTVRRIIVVMLIILVIDLGVMGLKIFDRNYNVISEGYIGLVCFLTILVCGIIKLFAEIADK